MYTIMWNRMDRIFPLPIVLWMEHLSFFLFIEEVVRNRDSVCSSRKQNYNDFWRIIMLHHLFNLHFLLSILSITQLPGEIQLNIATSIENTVAQTSRYCISNHSGTLQIGEYIRTTSKSAIGERNIFMKERVMRKLIKTILAVNRNEYASTVKFASWGRSSSINIHPNYLWDAMWLFLGMNTSLW